MILENYTPELFVENFIDDSEIFGKETTKAIYEEIFSAICGRKVKLDSLLEELDELDEVLDAEDDTIEEGNVPPAEVQDAIARAEHARQVALATNRAEGFRLGTLANMLNNEVGEAGIPKCDVKYYQGLRDTIRADADKEAAEVFKNTLKMNQEKIASKTAEAAGNTVKIGLLGKIGKFITSLPGKVKMFFGGLKGKSFSEIMKQGMGWLQANPALALKTTGGIALVALLIRALRKRGELSKYRNLQAIADRANSLKEDCFDTIIEDTKEKKAMREILKECETNKDLEKALFGEDKEFGRKYFKY